MPCGCQNTCGCTILGDNTTAVVVEGPGAGTFTVSSIPTIMGVAATPCILLEIDDDKILTATPIIDPDFEAVELSCGDDGLRADLHIDPSSTAIVTQSEDGLRVDVPPAAGGDGDGQPGDLIMHFGVGLRLNAIDADGDEVPRAGYPALWDALSLIATGGDRIVGDPTITGISGTRFAEPGMPLEATGFPFGTTVVAVSSTTITASAPADDSGSDTEVRVYPHGNGDGVSTFNTPDGNAVFPLGYDYQGGTNELGELGGAFDTTMTLANLIEHDHPATSVSVVTDPGHDHGASGSDSGHAHPIAADGSHQHAGAGASHDFLVEDSTPAGGFIYLHVDAVNVDTANTMRFTSNGLEGGNSYKPNREGNTFPAGSHSHGGATGSGNAAITVDVVPAATGITVATTTDVENAGDPTPDPIEVTPPYNVVRWMVHT